MKTTQPGQRQRGPAPHPAGQRCRRSCSTATAPGPRMCSGWSKSPHPPSRANEVLVQVRAAGVDRGTCHLMRASRTSCGSWASGSAGRRPGTRAGRGGHGRRDRRGITRFQAADEVFGIARGSFAEYAAAQEDKLVRKPGRLSFEQAAVRRGLRARRPARPARRAHPGRAEGPDHRRLRRRRQLRRATRQGLRSQGHRRGQHGEDGSGPLDRRQPGHRLHPGGFRRRPPAL